MNRLELLLEKIKLILYKYEQISKINIDSFNIFSILRDDRDEVNLHSRFIYELLNPNGSHNQGRVFVDIFLEKFGIETQHNDNIRVYKERYNIDILIELNHKAIIIENKIDTEDHSNQLSRYLKTVKSRGFKNIKLLYLTLNGDEPNEKLKDVNLISYKYDIKDWIESCIKMVALNPTLRETLVQYLNLIKKLTYQANDTGFIMEVKELLLEKENLKIALSLEDAITEAKIETQLIFWKSLLKKLQNRYSFVFYSYYGYKNIEESVRNYYTKKKNRKDYGYEFQVDNGVYFFIEIRDNIYYGFYSENFSEKQKSILDSIDINWESPYWKYPDKMLNFEHFKSDNVLNLLDEVQREIDIEKISSEITYLIESYREKLKKLK